MDHLGFPVQEIETVQYGTKCLPYQVLVKHSVSCEISQFIEADPKRFVNKANLSAMRTLNFKRIKKSPDAVTTIVIGRQCLDMLRPEAHDVPSSC